MNFTQARSALVEKTNYYISGEQETVFFKEPIPEKQLVQFIKIASVCLLCPLFIYGKNFTPEAGVSCEGLPMLKDKNIIIGVRQKTNFTFIKIREGNIHSFYASRLCGQPKSRRDEFNKN